MSPINIDIVQTKPVSTVILMRRETRLLVRRAMVRFFMLHNDKAMAQVMVVLQTRSKTAQVCSKRVIERSLSSRRNETHSDRLVHFAHSDCRWISVTTEKQ